MAGASRADRGKAVVVDVSPERCPREDGASTSAVPPPDYALPLTVPIDVARYARRPRTEASSTVHSVPVLPPLPPEFPFPIDRLRERLLGVDLLPRLLDFELERYLSMEVAADARVAPLRPPSLLAMLGALESVDPYLPFLQRVRLFQPQTFSPRIMRLPPRTRHWMLCHLGRCVMHWELQIPVLMNSAETRDVLEDLSFLARLPGLPFDISWIRRRFDQLSRDRVFCSFIR